MAGVAELPELPGAKSRQLAASLNWSAKMRFAIFRILTAPAYHADGGCHKHQFCPESHLLLGLQIVFTALIIPLTVILVYFGYQLAHRGLDTIERGQRINGGLIFSLAGLLAIGGSFFLLLAGYWFAFEGGALVLLR
jgi:hypothetical protein